VFVYSTSSSITREQSSVSSIPCDSSRSIRFSTSCSSSSRRAAISCSSVRWTQPCSSPCSTSIEIGSWAMPDGYPGLGLMYLFHQFLTAPFSAAHPAREEFGVVLALARPATAADPPHTSMAVWVVAALLLAVVVFGGLVLASRR